MNFLTCFINNICNRLDYSLMQQKKLGYKNKGQDHDNIK